MEQNLKAKRCCPAIMQVRSPVLPDEFPVFGGEKYHQAEIGYSCQEEGAVLEPKISRNGADAGVCEQRNAG